VLHISALFTPRSIFGELERAPTTLWKKCISWRRRSMCSDQDDWMEAWISCALSVRQRDIEEEVRWHVLDTACPKHGGCCWFWLHGFFLLPWAEWASFPFHYPFQRLVGSPAPQPSNYPENNQAFWPAPCSAPRGSRPPTTDPAACAAVGLRVAPTPAEVIPVPPRGLSAASDGLPAV